MFWHLLKWGATLTFVIAVAVALIFASPVKPFGPPDRSPAPPIGEKFNLGILQWPEGNLS